MATGTGAPTGPATGLARAAGLGASLTLALVSLLAMGEVGRLVGEVFVRGSTHSASVLYSALQTRQLNAALQDWAYAACGGSLVRTWLVWVVVFDLPFILGYAGLALGATRRWPKLRIRRWIVALVVIDVVEDVLSFIVLAAMPTGAACRPFTYSPGVLAAVLSGITVVKTVVAAMIVVRILWVAFHEDEGHAVWRRVTTALGLQRFVLIVVAVLAALLLLSGMPLLEQGVDVERGWVLNGDTWLGIAEAAWAVLFFALLAAALRYLAQLKAAPMAIQRVDGTYQPAQPVLPPEPVENDQADQPSWLVAFRTSLLGSWRWLVAFLVTTALILVAWGTPIFRVQFPSALALPLVLVVIPVASAASARVSARPPTYVDHADVRRLALRVGRALAYAVPAILLVSVCRAMVGPMMVLRDGDQAVSWIVFGVVALVAVGYVTAVLWQNPDLPDLTTLAESPLHLLQPELVGARRLSADDTKIPGPFVSVLPAALLTLICAVPLLVWPETTARFLSVLGTIALTLLGLTGLYATLQIVAHLNDAPHVFQIFRLIRTPVIGLTLLVALVATLLGAGLDPHRIRPGSITATDDRPSLRTALDTWLSGQSADCSIRSASPGTPALQPLVLVAAEGGGVRAAWWTVDAMTALTSTDCGRRSVFLASGVSGGATGLAVMAASADPYADMKRIAGPDALSGAVEGLLSRDLLAGSLGIQVASADEQAGVRFPDRAALMEQAWERESTGLGKPFPRTGAEPAVPWFTVFNGTSVANTCRVLVGDVRLTSAQRCDAPGNTVPGAYDLFAAVHCDLGLPTSTASMLAARFPYVTPSGVISSCTPAQEFFDQLIDGGYSENSGLDTVNAALAQLLPSIRAHNATALDDGSPLVVPLVVFLHNTVVAAEGGVPRTPTPKPEVLVPPLNLSDSSVLGDPATLLQRSAATAADWLPASADPAAASAARASFDRAVGSSAMTVAPEEVPALALPLGWTLSQGTRDALDAALNAYLTCSPDDTHSCSQSSAFDKLLRQWGTEMTFPGQAH